MSMGVLLYTDVPYICSLECVSFSSFRVVANLRRCLHYHISDNISTEDGHAQHVLVKGTRWMPDLLRTIFFRFRRCPVTFAQ